MIHDGSDTMYMEPDGGGGGGGRSLEDRHYVWKHSDLTANLTCGSDSGGSDPLDAAAPHSSHNNQSRVGQSS